MWTKKFWLESLDRALKSAVQAPLTMWGIAKVSTISGLDWKNSLSLAGASFIVSLATSIVSAPIGSSNSPSIL